jgi:hypothetical protein
MVLPTCLHPHCLQNVPSGFLCSLPYATSTTALCQPRHCPMSLCTLVTALCLTLDVGGRGTSLLSPLPTRACGAPLMAHTPRRTHPTTNGAAELPVVTGVASPLPRNAYLIAPLEPLCGTDHRVKPCEAHPLCTLRFSLSALAHCTHSLHARQYT